jgi:polar amino acid transport system substrate-binding protein
VDFQVTSFDSITAGLDTLRYQIGANDFGKNPEREQKYIFSEPMARNANALVTKSGSSIRSLSDLAGKTTEVLPGVNYTTVLENYNKEHPGNKIKLKYTEADLTTRVNDVVSGKIDFLLYDAVSLNTIIKERGLKVDFKNLSAEDEKVFNTGYEYLLFAKNADGEKLAKEINAQLKILNKNGTMLKYSQKFFGGDYVPAADNYK